MRFGLFGGAPTRDGGPDGYRQFGGYNIEAEAPGAFVGTSGQSSAWG